MLPEVDSLPRTEGKVAGLKRDRETGRRQRRADVTRHIVRALSRMTEMRIPLGDMPPKPLLQVVTRRGIRVLLNKKAGGRVLDHQRAKALQRTAGVNHRLDLRRDFVEAVPPRPDRDVPYQISSLFIPF